MNSARHRGFTLVELIVILAVMAILAAVAVPMALRLFQVTAEEGTREEMDNIKKAILGDPRKLQSSFRSDFGFLGDIGCLPDDLRRIFTNSAPPLPSSLPTWSFDSGKQAGAGWKGPYITGAATGEETDDYTKDQWGNSYTYTPAAGPCPLTATLTSNGPDGQPGGDDISISIGANETTATVRGSVTDSAGVGLEGVPVEIYSAVAGTLTTTTTNTDANGDYLFTSVPFGARAVRALPRLVYSPGSVTTAGGGTDITFSVVNYSNSAFVVDFVRAVYTGGGTYNQIRIDGVAVDPPGTFSSGTNVNVTNTSIAASSATRPSMRVYVDSPDSQLPRIVISGQGTVARIELNNFSVDKRGTPFTVTFTDTGGVTSIVKFTP